MSVDRHCWSAQAEEQDAGGGFGPDAVERRQPRFRLGEGKVIEKGEVFGSDLFPNRFQNRLDPRCLAVGQSAATNGIGQELGVGEPSVVPGRKCVAETSEGAGGVRVRGILGEDGGDQLRQWLTIRT